MNLIIRNLQPSVVKELDEQAKKSKLSRQNYLKNLLENHVLIREINNREMELKNTLEKNTEIISLMVKQLERNNELLEIILEDE